MSFNPDPRLCNLPREVFERYGKPHVMCHYEGRSIKSHRLDDGALCSCCGKLATNAHHWPPVRNGTVNVSGKVLRPSLIAVCGSGTTGCHDGWHGGARYTASWRWDDESCFEQWLGGWFWDEGFEPHDPRLYLFGYWEFTDKRKGRIWNVREC